MRAPVLLMALAWSTVTLEAVLLLVGAFDAHLAAAVSLRPARLLLGAAVALVLTRRLARRAMSDVLDDGRTTRLQLLAFLSVLAIVVLQTGVDSVGGSDSAGYLAQAQRWRDGTVRAPLPFPDLPVRNAAWLQSPLGFRPGPRGDTTVPVPPPGLSLLEALALTGGHTLAVRILPALFAVLAIGALYRLGRVTQRPETAMVGAATFAFSPPFLFQALQPMSDVAALAAWLVALSVALGPSRGAMSASVAGLAAAVAVAVRPNLAPLLLVVGWAFVRGASSSRAHRWQLAALAVLPGTAVGVAYVALQATLYGTPWVSGYGSASELFSLRHVWPNVSRQVAWLLESHPWPTLVVLAGGAISMWHPRLVARHAVLAAMLVWLLYVCYVPFDNWTYLRFVLLPLAVITLGGAGVLGQLLRGYRSGWRWALHTLALAVLVAMNVVSADRLGVFDLHRHEARYKLAADFVQDHAPRSAVVLAAQHSASVVAYTRHPVLRLDLLDPADVEPLLAWLRARHHPLVVVLDDDEREAVVQPLAAADELSLDWPARANVGLPTRTRVWFLDDRLRFRDGERVPSTTLRPARR
jgi:hypothetical protein